ncbi:CD0519/CD1768 family membrane protein [Helicovermis profundi]|uniref:Transporter gate domain protein n=1 Tax=Helicovermis profundi TaxID=3065157 RepID=A0AAU9E9I6_9FIRM|nr:hypothetical protein HLPR_17530 [Clostridia bacterium S502]
MESKRVKKAISKETFVFLGVSTLVFIYISNIMGVGPMFNVIMKTAHDLLINTVFFIMAIAVLAGAFSALLSEFGVVALINKIISPIMKPLYDLPGAASIGAITTFLSDNPAIISLAKDKGFSKYFKDYQTPALCNLGTAFGMGLILSTFMISQGTGTEFVIPVLIGILSAIIGSIVSVKIMMIFTKKFYGYKKNDPKLKEKLNIDSKYLDYREVREGSVLERVLDSILDGGKTGVELGLEIIPGVLVICTVVMLLTFEPSTVNGVHVYKGVAYEGIGLLPKIGDFLSFIIKPLFGFTSSKAVAFPITSLGSAGAALALVPKLLKEGLISSNEIAVFTAMGMCWSGYLSTHVGMMDSLGVRKLANKAIFSHTIGGLAAGISAHFIYLFISSLL